MINAFETGQIDPEPLVTRVVALEQLDSAFASLMGTATDSKILVDPRQVLVARGGVRRPCVRVEAMASGSVY